MISRNQIHEQRWTLKELQYELDTFERELRAAGYAENSVNTYIDRSARFLKWLAGEYKPELPKR